MNRCACKCRHHFAFVSLTCMTLVVFMGDCTSGSGIGGLGQVIPVGSPTLRPLTAGDFSTYNYRRTYADNSRRQGTMTLQVTPYSSTTFGQGLTQTRTFNWDVFDSAGNKVNSSVSSVAWSAIAEVGSDAATKAVEISDNGSVSQITDPPGGFPQPLMAGVIQVGQSFSYSYSLSDGETTSGSLTVVNTEQSVVPFGSVETFKISTTEVSQDASGHTTRSRTTWRHPVLGVIKRDTQITFTATGSQSETSNEVIELVSTNIAVPS